MCYVSLVWSMGRFMAVLWVVLYFYVGDSSEAARSIHRRKTAVNLLQVTDDSSVFHSLFCFKIPLPWERIKIRQTLQPFPVWSHRQNLGLNSALPLKDSDTAWDFKLLTLSFSRWHQYPRNKTIYLESQNYILKKTLLTWVFFWAPSSEENSEEFLQGKFVKFVARSFDFSSKRQLSIFFNFHFSFVHFIGAC